MIPSRPFVDALSSCSEQYNLEYYLEFTRKLTELGIHVLAIKDMAGLLKPAAATMLVSVSEREPPGDGAFRPRCLHLSTNNDDDFWRYGAWQCYSNRSCWGRCRLASWGGR